MAVGKDEILREFRSERDFVEGEERESLDMRLKEKETQKPRLIRFFLKKII